MLEDLDYFLWSAPAGQALREETIATARTIGIEPDELRDRWVRLTCRDGSGNSVDGGVFV